MAAKKLPHVFKAGDRVRLRYSEWRGRIVEERGALGPGGALIFRVRVAQKPKPFDVEVFEDQLILIPTSPKVGPSAVMTNAQSEPQTPKIRPKKERGRK